MSNNNTREKVEQAQESQRLAANEQHDQDTVETANTVEAEDVVEGEVVEEAPAEEPSIEDRLREAEAKAAEYLDGWQRARAEFANARRRLDKERVEARRTATVEVIKKLLPILDDFQRALESVPEPIAQDSWFEGVALVHRKLRGILDSEQIQRIEAMGQPFDPTYHEAVLQEESDEHESGTVIRELQSGYRLGDRVIRPAMVVVAA